jgi:hypothetical protein
MVQNSEEFEFEFEFELECPVQSSFGELEWKNQ